MNSVQFSKLSVRECRHGLMVWPKADATIGRALGLYGEFAEGENLIMSRYVKPGDLAIDVGANLGTTVLPLARSVGERGQVLAFEPQPLMQQCLQTTLTLNECLNVRVFSAAVGDRTGWARIQAPDVDQGGNYGGVALGSAGMQVPLIRLDDLELPACHLVKIDVEGFEWNVIQGAREQLMQHRPALYLEAKRIPGTQAYLQWLMEHGWRCWWHFAFFYRADNFRKNAENVFGGTGDMNILALPAEHPAPPADLPEIRSPNEDWQQVYASFYQALGKPMP